MCVDKAGLNSQRRDWQSGGRNTRRLWCGQTITSPPIALQTNSQVNHIVGRNSSGPFKLCSYLMSNPLSNVWRMITTVMRPELSMAKVNRVLDTPAAAPFLVLDTCSEHLEVTEWLMLAMIHYYGCQFPWSSSEPLLWVGACAGVLILAAHQHRPG